MITRRHFIGTGAAAAGATVFLPYAAMAAAHASDMFSATGGDVTVHPVAHASFVMETPVGTIYNDPVGAAEQYSDFPAPDLILITHEHGDHYSAETLEGIVGPTTQIVANPAVFEMLPDGLKARATSIGNGEETTVLGLKISAIPAYNLTEDRLQYHPQGRDNGYILSFEGLTVYIAGDTEDIPEMRALSGIDVAFVPFNLPYTMDEEQAASAVAEFAPKYVYPYHYRDLDVDKFATLLSDAGASTEVKRGPWYGEQTQG
ncbi:beta-lactamase [Oceanicola sp. 22II-s10i]|uniref:MBL fold metallo-hydrolase n=1 Tax=Oceanicola sp. 22II-s10i TaxID=1317116 RepID=UPI000B51FD2B|nr:MBL fold metallo-hydrolase [Oceanicola sp. 22II-s10i]OWU85037.1 beta-lactamase [Oceanicola sp. 22II-s10i]